jgi:hypothetical protein
MFYNIDTVAYKTFYEKNFRNKLECLFLAILSSLV